MIVKYSYIVIYVMFFIGLFDYFWLLGEFIRKDMIGIIVI